MYEKISDDAKRSPIFFIHVAHPIFSGITRKKPSNICIIMSQNLTCIIMQPNWVYSKSDNLFFGHFTPNYHDWAENL